MGGGDDGGGARLLLGLIHEVVSPKCPASRPRWFPPSISKRSDQSRFWRGDSRRQRLPPPLSPPSRAWRLPLTKHRAKRLIGASRRHLLLGAERLNQRRLDRITND